MSVFYFNNTLMCVLMKTINDFETKNNDKILKLKSLKVSKFLQF